MPLEDWPQADRTLWLALRQRGGPFDDRGALAHLRDSSARMYVSAYGRWLEWLRREDPAALNIHPALRATLPRMRTWLEAMQPLQPTSRAIFFTNVLRVLAAAAPDADWSAHRRLRNGLAQAAGRGDPGRKAGRILSSQILLEAGLRHAGPEAEAAPTPLQRAVRQRDGAMIALLAMVPMRHRAFSGLRIGHSLLIGPATLSVALPEELTKSGRPWEADIPEPASKLLRRYVEATRPFLMDRGGHRHDLLWVGNEGAPMGYSYIGRRIPDITSRLTGVRIPPHFFRDAAATTLARASPAAARVIAPVLAHSDRGTAERHYIQAGSIEAARDYADVLRRLRRHR